MLNVITLSQARPTQKALKLWVEFLFGPNSYELEEINQEDEYGGFYAGKVESRFTVLFDRISACMEKTDSAEQDNRTIILADSIDLNELNPVREGPHWNTLLAQLILSFPDVIWKFGVIRFQASEADARFGTREETSKAVQHIRNNHSLLSRVGSAYREPLFDPSGLREWIRLNANAKLRELGHTEYIKQRPRKAAAIDEEFNYAYFHGFVGYKAGFRTDVVSSWNLMSELFNTSKAGDTETKENGERDEVAAGHDYCLLLEDMSLNFADKEKSVHLLQLGCAGHSREEHCSLLNSGDPAVERSELRLLITTGQYSRDKHREHSHNINRTLELNKAYLRVMKSHGKGDVLMKPVDGVYGLLSKLAEHEKIRSHFDEELKQILQEDGKGKREKKETPYAGDGSDSSPDKSNHGAPGKLYEVARKLLMRSERLFKRSDVSNIEKVQAAVFSMDAFELLQGRTPTFSLAALCQMHEYETDMENDFFGVGHSEEIEKRVKHIDAVIDKISEWYDERNKGLAASSARIKILSRLKGRMEADGQFAKMNYLNDEVRKTNRNLELYRARHDKRMGSRVWNWILKGVEWVFPSFKRWAGISFLLFILLVLGVIVLTPADILDAEVWEVSFQCLVGDKVFKDNQAVFIYSVIFNALGKISLGILLSQLFYLLQRR